MRETTRDVTFLHNGQFFAAAQAKYAYIYDRRGLEVHCLREHARPAALQFLPHHFLLASIGEAGALLCCAVLCCVLCIYSSFSESLSSMRVFVLSSQ